MQLKIIDKDKVALLHMVNVLTIRAEEVHHRDTTFKMFVELINNDSFTLAHYILYFWSGKYYKYLIVNFIRSNFIQPQFLSRFLVEFREKVCLFSIQFISKKERTEPVTIVQKESKSWGSFVAFDTNHTIKYTFCICKHIVSNIIHV